MAVNVLSPDGSLDRGYVSNYALTQIRDRLTRVDGIGDVQIFGARDYAMRVWIDPGRAATLGLTAGEVVDALRKQNVQVAIPELKSTFRGIPRMRGSKDPDSTHRHLLICWMEFRALAKYMGEEEAASVLQHFVKEKRFPWIYGKILKEHRKIEKIVRKYEFIPDELYPKVNLMR